MRELLYIDTFHEVVVFSPNVRPGVPRKVEA